VVLPAARVFVHPAGFQRAETHLLLVQLLRDLAPVLLVRPVLVRPPL
jgi:hypothetical protein